MTSAGAEIRQWFGRTRGGGLILPNGWFGRPYDNVHQLTHLDEWSSAILLELDEQLLLVIPSKCTASSSERELSIVAPSPFVFWWREYGSLKPHQQIFPPGEIRFAHGLP